LVDESTHSALSRKVKIDFQAINDWNFIKIQQIDEDIENNSINKCK